MKEVGGHTRPFAVLGHPVAHSLSPCMHNASFAALDFDGVYLALDVAPDDLESVIPALGAAGFGGLNITVPLKERAFAALTRLGESARTLGSVNTVVFTERGPEGHNTDGDGFIEALREAFGRDVDGTSVFVLGAGGAGRVAALYAAGQGASALVLSDLDNGRLRRLEHEIRERFPGLELHCTDHSGEAAERARDSELLVQATPVGMKPEDSSPLPDRAFRGGQRAFDLIYMYPETAFLRAAREAGAETANGLGMLLHQGARAFTLWTGLEPDTGAMRGALKRAVYGEGGA
ncbi:shikimate dehydrogenase [Kiritimatiella glycovorans]|uniref:Shikimate dehydrogenase (NADP(+)) n=1 Tax=Kiritimatiella glycovorans TaxID=1307763 RepID=A0A0G3EBB1_9BACT|nr:shikimate dehydrogenase [Kiritimatiella glycovorans]AKJ63781.1 Shikimate dehydrogenase [Kiritimatiella glycovorans]